MTPAPAPGPVLAVTGLRAEARIAAGVGVEVVAGGGDPARLASLLRMQLDRGAGAILSFGIAGGLSPGVGAGTVVVADAVHDAGVRRVVHARWRATLHALVPAARSGDVAGVDAALASPDDKADLGQRTGAVAVDMESHIAARLAWNYGVPFAILRVVADPAERALPRAALVGMRPDGTTDVGAVLGALARHPAELSALIRTALDAQAAFRSLRLCRRLAGDRFGFAPAGHEAE